MARIKAARIVWSDFGYATCSFVAGSLAAGAESMASLAAAFAQHSQWVNDRQRFAQSAGMDIERIATHGAG